MCKGLLNVESIIRAKQEVTNGRDLLKNVLRYLKDELPLLEQSLRKNYSERLKDNIANNKKIIELVSESITRIHEILKPIKELPVLSAFLESSDVVVEHIQTIKSLIAKSTGILVHKFKGIQETCDAIIKNIQKIRILTIA